MTRVSLQPNLAKLDCHRRAAMKLETENAYVDASLGFVVDRF
jgi:hypothetical protein